MSDVESVSTISGVDKAPTVTKTKRTTAAKKQAANGGLRWTSEQLEKLWDHRHYTEEKTWYRKCDCAHCENLTRTGTKPKGVADPPYKGFEEKHQKSAQACRLKIHHITKDYRTGAISLEDALAGKPLPSQQAAAKRKQAAAGKRARSLKDASADKLLPGQACESQEQAPAERRALSPEDVLAQKHIPYQPCESHKQAAAEKRGFSPEDALAKKPRSAQAFKARKQAAAERKAASPKKAVADKPRSGQASKPQQRSPTEKPPAPAFKPRELTFPEKIACFRDQEGERVDPVPAPPVLPPTKEAFEAAVALMALKTQEQVPEDATPPRRDTLVGASFGGLKIVGPGTSSTETIEDRSISSAEKFH